MAKLRIEDAKAGVSDGGIACGPCDGQVIAEVCIRDLEDNTVAWYSLAEAEGTLNFMLTGESTFDGQIEEDYDDTDFWDMIAASEDGGYDDYNEFYADLEALELCDEKRRLIWKYLAYLVRCSEEEAESMKAMSIGKCLGDFEIPVCDAEKDYLDDREDGDSGEDADL